MAVKISMEDLAGRLAQQVVAGDAVLGRDYFLPGRTSGKVGDKVKITGRRGEGSSLRIEVQFKDGISARLFVGQSLTPVDPTDEEKALVPVKLAKIMASRNPAA